MTPAKFFEHFQTLSGTPNAVAKMRQFIIELAVRGKLTTPDRNDGPADAFRSRVFADNIGATAVLPGQVTSHIPTRTLNGPYDLPTNWCWTTMGALIESMANGIYKPSTFYSDSGTGCLRMYNIRDGQIDLTNLKRMQLTSDELERYRLEECDLLVNRVNSRVLVGKAAIVGRQNEPLVFESKNIRVRFVEESCLPSYVNLFFRTRQVREAFEGSAKQTCGQASVNQPMISALQIPLPPLAEQRRIVAKVNDLMKLCDELEEREKRQRETRQRLSAASLDRLLAAHDAEEFAAQWQRICDHFDLLYDAPETIEQLRQAILQLAVRGKLTRRDRVGVVPELPLGSLLLEDSLNGCSKAPQTAPPGVEILRISAGTSRSDGIVDEDDHKWVDLRDHEVEKFRLLPGDLLACRFNGNLHFVGRFSLYLGTSQRVQVNPDKLIRFRLELDKADPRYVRYAMNSRDTRAKIEAFCATTAGNIGISATNLKSATLPVPTLDEQHAIVACVDHLMFLCDGLVSRLCRSRIDGGKLLAAAVNDVLTKGAGNCVTRSTHVPAEHGTDDPTKAVCELESP